MTAGFIYLGLVDFNVNPLREGMAIPFPSVLDSKITLTTSSGLGVVSDQTALNKYLVYEAGIKN